LYINRANEAKMNSTSLAPLPRVGIDVGGTFTDFVVLDGPALRIHKVSTTPADQSRAIVAGLQALGLPAAQIVHGMTVATNALLERKGARTALLTTAGFGDVLAIGRQNRPALYALHQQRPPALVEDALRLEVAERVDAAGAVLEPLDEGAFDALAATLRAAQAESLAIVFLFSFRAPAHEARAAALLRERLPGLPLSLSSEILPEYREYERTATTVINAYVQPLVARYLERLEAALAPEAGVDGTQGHTLRILQSNGGAIGPAQAAQQPARLVLSGPAGGVVGAFAVAHQALRSDDVRLLTFDMGGTSTDVALCPGAIPTTAESQIGDLPLRLPVIDIHTVGAGGGSIAWLDGGGALRVGPQSAGALPGPVCYGRGGNAPTVTDANLVLGRLDAAAFLGGAGDVALNAEAAHRALAGLGAALGFTGPHLVQQAALGVLRVADATMERALRRVSVERGHDPRTFTLLPFGGAGPLHVCSLAQALGVARVLVPPFPGVLSAWGMLVADVSSETSTSLLRTAPELLQDPGPVAAAVTTLEARVRMQLAGEGDDGHPLTFDAALDLRYRGQSYELTVPLALPVEGETIAAAITAFHAAHAQRYGHALEDSAAVEVVTLRLRGTVQAGAHAALPAAPAPTVDAAADDARTATRAIWFADAHGQAAALSTPVFDRARLVPGATMIGPALVTQYDSTLLLPPGWQATVDPFANLHLTPVTP
jgi:N-methylhydantoinase A